MISMMIIIFLLIIRIVCIYRFLIEDQFNESKYLLYSEISLETDEGIFIYQDYGNMILSVFLVIVTISILILSEKKYKEYLVKKKESTLFLYSLEISNIENKEIAWDIEKLFNMLRIGDNVVLKSSFIYDTKDFLSIKDKEQLQKNMENKNYVKNTGNESRNLIDDKKHSFDHSLDPNRLIEPFRTMEEKKFSKKVIYIINDLTFVNEILNVYNSGLLKKKIKKDLKRGSFDRTISIDEQKILERATNDENGYIEKIKISLAHDINDLVWENFGNKKKISNIFFKSLVIFIFCLIFWILAFILQYYATKNVLYAKFIDNSKGIIININGKPIILTGLYIGLKLVHFAFRIFGIFFIESFLENYKYSYESTFTNIVFIFITLFELIYLFPISHYGYQQAVMNLKSDILKKSQIEQDNFFEFINTEWIIISFSLCLGTITKYIIFFFKSLLEKYFSRKEDDPKPIKIDHTIASANIVNVFMYLGFYQTLLCFTSLIFLFINMAFIKIFDMVFKKVKSYYNNYLSYKNITMIIQFSLLSFSIGGLFAFNNQFIFTKRYFDKNYNEDEDQIFPYFLITNIIIFIFICPSLYIISRHNTVYLRIMNYLLFHNESFKEKHKILNEFQKIIIFQKILFI